MTIGKQLASLMGGFTVAAAASVVVVSLFQFGMQKETRQMAADASRHSKELFAVLRSVDRQQDITQQIIREKDPDRIEAKIEESRKIVAEARTSLQALRAEGADLIRSFDALRSADEKCVESYLKGEVAVAQQFLIEEANPAFDAILGAVGAFHDSLAQQQEVAAAAAERRASRMYVLLFLCGGLAMAGLFACGLFIVRRINTNIRRAVMHVFASVNETSGAAGQLLAAADEQSQGASKQAANIVETSAAGDEINTMAVRNGESSRQAASLMERSRQRFDEASRAIEGMVSSIEAIHSTSNDVAKIMKVVDGIAFQTNILALNAAVEAARAGEAGAGFSVVADEVRNLAQRSAQAAKDTADLMDQSIRLTTDGKNRVSGLVEVMRAITQDVNAAAALVGEVSQGSEEQARGTQQIARALADMESLTQRGASSAEESAAAARELEAQAQSLTGVVENILALVGRDRAA